MANKKVIVDTYDAVGGPEKSVPGGDGFQAGPTNAGNYTVAYCGRHSSTRYAAWSKIRWGSPIKEEKGDIFVQHDGRWRRLDELTTVTRDNILDYHEELYGTRMIPTKWVFNDFGHTTCYYFNDVNHDGKFDKKTEKIEGEFIHTTPPNEAETAKGSPVILTESHGCTHVKPADIDALIKKGYLKSGNAFVVHKYTESAPNGPYGVGAAPYEVHFYPKSKKFLIYGLQKTR